MLKPISLSAVVLALSISTVLFHSDGSIQKIVVSPKPLTKAPVWAVGDGNSRYFQAEIVEVRQLRNTDRAYAVGESPSVYLKLRIVVSEKSPNPLIVGEKEIALAVDHYFHALEQNNLDKVTLHYDIKDGKLTSLMYLGC